MAQQAPGRLLAEVTVAVAGALFAGLCVVAAQVNHQPAAAATTPLLTRVTDASFTHAGH